MEIEQVIRDVARECYEKGPGYAQEWVVLREVASRVGDRLPGTDVERAQTVLTHWHDLFRRGELSWGYDLDSPNSPWFHFPKRETAPRS
jgi:hypothetical protein